MKRIICVLMIVLAVLLTSCGTEPSNTSSSSADSATSAQAADVTFAEDIQPIFNQNCIRCHGGRGSLFLDSYENVMQGGVSGPVVVASDVDGSLLVKRITGEITPRMPAGGDSLSQSDIDLIKNWIGAGALDN